jgi:hypothetical protein
VAAPNSPYLAGLTVSDFLFQRMKSQQHCFQDVIEIQEQLLTFLPSIPKCQFLQCFHSGRNTVPTALIRKGITLKDTAMIKAMLSAHFFLDSVQELLEKPLYHTK